MANKQLQIIQLDPNKHGDSVSYFRDYFNLPAKNPGLVFLEEILARFATLPYENISKIIKFNRNWDTEINRIRLPEEVIDGHVSHKLGGTCFSLTFFLQAILKEHRFESYPVMADMQAGENIHCCLIVLLDGQKYLVDPGYLLTRPMAIDPEQPKLFRSEFSGVELRYDDRHDVYNLSTFDQNQSKWRYRFRDRPVSTEEFLQHWLASFNWNSMHYLCLTKVMKDGQLYIRRDFMRETTFTGKKNFNIKRTLHAAINERFGIEKRIVEQARVALEENLQRERDLGIWIPRD